MKIVAKNDNFKLPPEDLLVGTLKEIEDLGIETDPFDPESTRHQVRMVWTLQLPDGTTAEQFAWLTFSLHVKAKLYKVVRALRGGSDPKDGEEIELNDFIGKKAKLQIEHYKSKGNTRSKIVGYYPLPNIHGVVTTDDDLPENLR